MNRRLAAAVVAVAAWGPHAAAGDPAAPLPVDKTKFCPAGQAFTVEGRVRIPKGVMLSLQKDTVVEGKGDAVIEVEGELKAQGADGARVVFRNVSIEPQAKLAQVALDGADFDGKTAGVRTPKDVPVDGRIVVHEALFTNGASIDVTMAAGGVDLQRILCAAPVRVRAVDPKSGANKVKLSVIGCLGTTGGLLGGLVVEGVSECTVRSNVLRGETVTFSDCAAVAFDTNYVTASALEFRQSKPGGFGKTKIAKCDFAIFRLVAFCPMGDGKPETLTVEHCWFGGDTSWSAIRDRFVQDRSRDRKIGVMVDIVHPLPEPHQLGWAVKK